MSYPSYPPRQSRGVKDFFEERLSKPAEPNIYNLDAYFSRNTKINPNANPNPLFNSAYYLRCKSFIDSVRTTIGRELDSNTGHIIDLYTNPDYQAKPEYSEMLKNMQEIKELYKKLYLDGLQSRDHQLTRDGVIYPNYYEDLYQKGNKPYELLEQSLGLKHQISEQSNVEFLETLEKRVVGLKQCQENPNGQKPGADVYFGKEYIRENAPIEPILAAIAPSTPTTPTTPTTLITEKCKLIYYSHDNFIWSSSICGFLFYN